jgi:hypothetical protein
MEKFIHMQMMVGTPDIIKNIMCVLKMLARNSFLTMAKSNPKKAKCGGLTIPERIPSSILIRNELP